MAHYYVNNRPQANGDHEVHVDGCHWLARATDKLYLGNFSSCRPAVTVAKKTYSTANGCATCCKECHTS